MSGEKRPDGTAQDQAQWGKTSLMANLTEAFSDEQLLALYHEARGCALEAGRREYAELRKSRKKLRLDNARCTGYAWFGMPSEMSPWDAERLQQLQIFKLMPELQRFHPEAEPQYRVNLVLELPEIMGLEEFGFAAYQEALSAAVQHFVRPFDIPGWTMMTEFKVI